MDRTASTPLALCRRQRSSIENALALIPSLNGSVRPERSGEHTHRGGEEEENSGLRARIRELERQLAEAKAEAGVRLPQNALPTAVRAQQLYDKFKAKTSAGVTKEEFAMIMEGMGLEVDEESVSAVFQQLDINKDGLICLDEWLAFADEVPVLNMGDDEPFDKSAASPSPPPNSRFVFEPETVARTASSAPGANPKSVAMFVDTKAFDAGVEGLIGRADPNTRAAIKAEHCLSEDSMDNFQTINTGIMTTSYKEYWIVAGPGGDDEDAPEPLPEPDPTEAERREIRPLTELLEMDFCKEAGLMWEEILALRLYSGPMYMKYNTLLRQMPHDMLEKLKGNKYTTTIHLILSGILKISKVQRIPKDRLVYRGLGGRKLPKMFYLRDENGCRGGLEAGFMSTTTTKDVALKYSGCGQLAPNMQHNNIIFEIELGKMSMGANISQVSQYPGENEILFTPLTHLEIVGKPRFEETLFEGQTMKVFVVRLRATTNQKSLTLDQLLVERKTMLLDLGRKLVNQCNQLIGSGAQQGKSYVLEVTGDTSQIPMTDLMREASKVKDLEDHIKADIMGVEATAFNDLVIYQDTMRRLFEVFINACRGTAQNFTSQVDPAALLSDGSKLGVMIVRCIASVHLLERVPEDKEVLEMLSEMKSALIKLLKFQYETKGEVGSFKRQRQASREGGRSVRSMLASAKLDYGRLLHKLSKYPEAKQIFRDVIDARNEMDGPESFGALEAQECLGLVMYENRDLTEAMETFEKIHDVRQQNTCHDTDKDKKWKLGVADALCNMGRVHFRLAGNARGKENEAKKKQELDQAITLYNQSLQMRSEALTADSLRKDMVKAKLEEHLGAAHAHKGEPRAALAHYEASLNVKKQVLGPENVPIADILNLMGKPHLDLGQYNDALQLYRKSLNIKMRVLGETHASLSRSWSNMASVHNLKEEHDLAVECLEKALTINEEVYSTTSPHCVSVIEQMIDIREKQKGREKEVLKLVTRLVGVQRQILNPKKAGSGEGKEEGEQEEAEIDVMFSGNEGSTVVSEEEDKEVEYTEERFKTGRNLCERLIQAANLQETATAEETGQNRAKATVEQKILFQEALEVIDKLKLGEDSLRQKLKEKVRHDGPKEGAGPGERLELMVMEIEGFKNKIDQWMSHNDDPLAKTM